MITPIFKVEQNEDYIILSIKLKYVKISQVDFFIEKNNFRFHLKPYFLNLFFSDELVSSDNCISKYDVENGILECKLEKQIKGKVFKDINLLSNLLENNPKNTQTSQIKQKIEILNEDTIEEKEKTYTLEELNEPLHVDISAKMKNLSLVKCYKYGFNNEFSEVFANREVSAQS